ncbi:MAG: hypothetical protein IPL33_20435 [Sphingobacteriales bacterium]|nr:hypothetical protein [Sphingobacteriales bacterium]
MPNMLKSWKDFASVEDWIANTQVANSAVADIFAPLISTKVANTGTAIKESTTYHYEKSTAPASAKLLVYDKPCYETFNITDISQVRSLVLEAKAESYASPNGVFKQLAQKTKARTSILKEIEKLGWAKGAQQSTLNSLMTRWDSTLSMLTTLPQHPSSIPLMDFSTYEQLKAAEQGDLSAFTADKYKNMKAVISAFYAAYEALFDFTKKYKEEEQEILRFDEFYTSSEATNLLNKIPYIFFTAAEIKSLNMQETGDFTNKTVAGLEGKTKGFPVDRPKNTTYIGLGQHGERSKTDALTWADKKGSKIPNNPDPRTVPKNAILLTIAYLGWYVENKVCAELSGIPIDCLELKKMLFAGYNAGIEHIIRAIKSLYNNEDRNITWLKVAAVIAASDKLSADKLNEMKTYAENIPKRLTKLS